MCLLDGCRIAHIAVDVVHPLVLVDGLLDDPLLEPEGQSHREPQTQVRFCLNLLFLQFKNLIILIEDADVQSAKSDTVILIPVLDGVEVIVQLFVAPVALR